MIDPSVLDPSFIENCNDMLQLALMCCNEPPKAIAAQVGCSLSVIYKALDGTRSIPNKVRHKLSELNFTAAATVALESTGFIRLFGYRNVDRHIQSLILTMKLSDDVTNKELEKLPVLLLNKNDRKDLNDSDYMQVKIITEKLVDRANSSINLIMELDNRYNLDIEKYMSGKEKAADAVTSTAN